jgi:integrase/recombinase XerC
MKKTTALTTYRRPGTLTPEGASSLVEDFLAGRSPRTLEAYRQDLQDFARYVKAEDLDSAARLLLARGRGPAHEMAHAYRADLLARGLSPSTVNRRLAALRSLVKLARLFGMADFILEVESVKSQAYRDTRGPGRDGVRRLMDELVTGSASIHLLHAVKAARDLVLVRLLYDLGLRRGEAVALDLSDVDLQAGTVSILGKGRTEKETLTLPDPTKAVLETWISLRGDGAGPLFVNFDHARKGSRLTGRSVARIVARLGDKIGLKVRPHGLRHAAVTEALDVTAGDVRKVQRFSRHRDLRVLTLYDDNRQDLGGEVARLVAGRV